MTHLKIRGGPRLFVSKRLRPPRKYDPDRDYEFRYRSKRHADFPHVVKFSGGRSSGMLLCALLQNKILNAKRGDVVVFNNTGAEHPDTYEFAKECKQMTEDGFGIPFFWIEHQTYEEVRQGEWARLPSYRITNSMPWSRENRDGYHSGGEPFEEMLSWSGFVPNQFSRSCTHSLKLETTRMFLKNWFSCEDSISRQGHWQPHSQIDLDALYRRHCRSGGAVPKKIYLDKKAFVLSCPPFRPKQRFADFTNAQIRIDNPLLKKNSFGGSANLGSGSVEYVAFIGLRGDEPARVRRVAARAMDGNPLRYEGEHVYMTLADLKIADRDVMDFWNGQDWGLKLPSCLSNCVFCFLKGSANLKQSLESLQSISPALKNTPLDIAWWARIEQKYGRNLIDENRKRKPGTDVAFIGFFGSKRLDYQSISQKGVDAIMNAGDMKPCDCTD